MYGNSHNGDARYKVMVFPYMLEKSAEVFSFIDCAFSTQKSKMGTGRVVGWKDLGI